ncbi:MAG: S9 family peptidase [Candidatus Thorarchaeota archaeon]|nr:S9 family peptidase [Candidatus Thorarchaeota archaeon]
MGMSLHQSHFRKFLAVETAGGPTWHPGGSSIAFAYDAPGLYQVYTVAIERGRTLWPTRMTYEEDRCTDPRFLGDGTLLFIRDSDGNENFQIGSIGKEMDLAWLTNDAEAKHIVTHVAKDGFYFVANLEDKSTFDLYHHQIPMDRHEADLVYRPEEGLCSISIVSGDEKHAIVEQSFSNTDTNLLLLDIPSRKASNLTKHLNEARANRWSAIRWIDKDHILVATDYNHDLQRFAVLSLSGEFIPFEEIEGKARHEVSAAAHSPDSTHTYFTLNEGGYSSLWRGTFAVDGVRSLVQVELPRGAVISSGDERSFSEPMSLSPNHELLAVTVSTASSPVDIWIIDLDSHEMWKATSAGTAGLNPSSFIDAALRSYLSFDGLPVPYFKYIPKGDKPAKGWPAILLIHGGPESQILPDFYPVVQFYLSNGFAVFTPNIRGSSGYGRSYMDADNVGKRLDSIMDIKHLALHIRRNEPEVDGSRLVVYGGSYGGFAVLSAMTEHPDIWKAGVDIVGVSDFVTFLQNTAPWRRKLREGEYGSLDQDIEILKAISPIHKIENISAPLFIIQGDNDERVPLSESLQMYEKLKEKGLEVELMRFADEGHGLAKLENRIKAYSRVVEWLKEIV